MKVGHGGLIQEFYLFKLLILSFIPARKGLNPPEADPPPDRLNQFRSQYIP
jgi:hypothetical protein